jgi:hypothetical protein
MMVVAAGAALGMAPAVQAQSSWATPVDGNWATAANWTPVGVPGAAATATLGFAAPYLVSVTGSQTVGTLNLTNPLAILQINDASVLNVSGISNNGLIRIQQNGAPGNATRIHAAANPTPFTGTGQVRLNSLGNGDNDSSYLWYTAAANVITNGASHAITGHGRVYTNVNNQGLIMADVAAKGLFLVGQDKTNSGLITASNGGFVQLRSIAMAQTGTGSIESTANSPVGIQSCAVSGGAIDGAGVGGGIFYTGSNSLDAVTLANEQFVNDATLVNIGAGGVVNNGTWYVSAPGAPGNATRIAAAANTTVSGTGTIRLQGVGSGNGNNDSAYLTYANVAHVLTNGPQHSIKGYGRIYTNLVNDGAINADIAGKGIFLTSQPKANNGTITASNGGFIQFTGVDVTGNPAAQIISTDSASPVQFVNSSLSGGGFTTSGSGVFQYFGTNTLANLTVNGTHQVTDATLVNMATNLVNNGSWLISQPTAPGNATRIAADAANVTISGTGSIRLQGVSGGNGDNDSAYLTYGNVANVLTLGSGQTLLGYGRVYTNLVNNGSINADVAGKGIFFISQDKTNNATITASNGGFVQFRSVGVTGSPTSQMISTDATSPIQIVTSSMSGGGFTTSGTGQFQYFGNNSLSNLTVSGTHRITDATLVNLNTDLVNNGSWLISDPGAPGNATRMAVNAPNVAINGTGTIRLQGVNGGNGDNDSAYLTYGNVANVLTMGGGQTVLGYGRLYPKMVNNGTMTADVLNKGLFFVSQDKTNNGTIGAANGGFWFVRSSTMTQGVGGVMTAIGGSGVLDNGEIVGGSIVSAPANPVTAFGTSGIHGSTITPGSFVKVNDAGNLRTDGLVNNGTIEVQTVGGPGNQTRVTASVNSTVISGTGTVRLNSINNQANNDSAYLSNNNSGWTATLGSGQTLTGIGRMYYGWNVQGTIDPGHGATASGEIQAVSGAVTMAPTTHYKVQINGTPASGNFDRLTGSSSKAVAGALTVDFQPSYSVSSADLFDVVSGSSVSGTFSTVTLQNVPVYPEGRPHVAYLPNAVRVVMCYANCDGSATSPTLNVSDFACFLNKFASGDPYANCDNSTAPPTLNVSDFACFLNKFASGCQ